MFGWFKSQLISSLDEVQGNNQSSFPYVFDVSEQDVLQSERDVELLLQASGRVSRYCNSIVRKAEIYGDMISDNARAESAVLDLGIKSDRISKGLASKRREFKSVDRRFRNAAYALRGDDGFF